MAQSSRPCDGCGRDVSRTRPTGTIPRFCGEDCKPRCSVVGCDSALSTRSWCVFHYTRWKLAGDPLAPLTRGKNEGRECSIGGCSEPSRKRGWCASHYAQWTRTGEEPRPFGYRWATPRPCKVCGDPPGRGYREFCGATCRALWKFYGGEVPAFRECIGCGVKIDLTIRGKGGQRVKAVIKFCRRCKQDYNKYKLTAAQLAERDGIDCGICGEPVDMTIRRRDSLMCASVDHILPRSRGGTHEPENLQLAHLLCNHIKSDRQGYTLARGGDANV